MAELNETVAPVAEKVAEVVNESKTVEANTNPAETAGKEKPTSKQLLDYSKKEAEFIKKEVAHKAELQRIKDEHTKAQEELKFFKEFKTNYKTNPEEVLGKLGVTFDELTDAIIAYHDNKNKTPEPVSVEKVREEVLNELRKEQEAHLNQQRTQAIDSFQKEISSFITNNTESLPFLTTLHKQMGDSESPQELIFDIINEHYDMSGDILDIEEASKVAEEYFKGEWEKLNQNFSKRTSTNNVVEEPAKEPADNVQLAPASKLAPLKHVSEREQLAIDAHPIGNVQKMEFKVKDRVTPNSLTNNLAKPKLRVPYNSNKAERKDAIQRAVEAMELAEKRQR